MLCTTKNPRGCWSESKDYKAWEDPNRYRVVRDIKIVPDVFGNEVTKTETWSHEVFPDDLVVVTSMEYDDHGREIRRSSEVEFVDKDSE